MRGDGFGYHVDFHAAERLGCFDEPFKFGHLGIFIKARRLEFAIDPFFCRVGVLVCCCRIGKYRKTECDRNCTAFKNGRGAFGFDDHVVPPWLSSIALPEKSGSPVTGEDSTRRDE